MGQNREKHRLNSHLIIHCPTSERCERTSEWTSEWPNTQSVHLFIPLSFHLLHPTMVDNSQEYRLKYWATRSSVRSFARTAHSFARSLTSLTPSLVGKWMFFFLFSTIVQCFICCRLRSDVAYHSCFGHITTIRKTYELVPADLWSYALGQIWTYWRLPYLGGHLIDGFDIFTRNV